MWGNKAHLQFSLQEPTGKFHYHRSNDQGIDFPDQIFSCPLYDILFWEFFQIYTLSKLVEDKTYFSQPVNHS